MSTCRNKLTNRKSPFSASQLNPRSELAIRRFADYNRQAFVGSLADDGDHIAEARVVRILRDSMHTADPPPPCDGIGGLLETMADAATNSTNFFARRALLQVMAAHTEDKESAHEGC
jgi:hypothetical protein